jgi:mannose-6-phosphate isomerase-like protein (cupin superfamily)
VADKPVVARPTDARPIAVMGKVFGIAEWNGSGPPQLHVHYEDDEAWHILEGQVEFHFADGIEVAGPGTTVFVPAGVAHTYVTAGDANYLIVVTPRLRALIRQLHETPAENHAAVYKRHASELLES